MKILWLGDFYYDYDSVSEDIKEIKKYIDDNNLKTILNLEGPICTKSENEKIEKRGPNLASNKEAIIALKELRTIAVCLSNNHMMDFGEYGLNETINILNESNIDYFGAGKNINQATNGIKLDEKYYIISFGWNIEETVYADKNNAGCAPREKDIILNRVKELAKDNKKVIVCLHWGFEYNRYPMPVDIELAHSIIDNGAEMIIGHHSHCVQPFEIYKNKKIYYSLGNFYFSGKRKTFDKKFNEKIKNQSDYGIGVIWDTEKNNTKEIMVKYNKADDNSYIIKNVDKDILKDITNINYNSKDYYKLAKRNKNNSTPILTNNKNKNNKKIKRLYERYKIKKIIKNILGRK